MCAANDIAIRIKAGKVSHNMSDSDADVEIAAGPAGRHSPRRRRPDGDGQEPQPQRGGTRRRKEAHTEPCCVLAVIADDGRHCRWRNEFSANRHGCLVLLDDCRRQAGLSKSAVEAEADHVIERSEGKVTVFGMAVFLSFAFPGDGQGDGGVPGWLDDTAAQIIRTLCRLTSHSAGGGRLSRARSQSLLLFPVLAAAALAEPLAIEGLHADAQPASFETQLLVRLRAIEPSLVPSVVGGQRVPAPVGRPIPMSRFVQSCPQLFTFKPGQQTPIVSFMWGAIAEPLVRGTWPCDFALLSLRTPASQAHRLISGQPPPGTLSSTTCGK